MEGREFSPRGGDDHRRGRGRLQRAGYSVADIDWFVPHQANKRIIDGSRTSWVSTQRRSSPPSTGTATLRPASIPLALADAVADRRIERGDTVLLEAMGGDYFGARRSFAGEQAHARPLTV